MQKSGKHWGETSPVFNKNNVEVHRFKGRLGGYCSRHKHAHKRNMFVVERGELRVLAWKDLSGEPDSTVLSSGDTCVVDPGIFHKFEVLRDETVVYEIYWTELDSDDIERSDVGGIIRYEG